MVFAEKRNDKKKRKLTFTKSGENSFYEKKKKEAKINRYRKSKMLQQYSKLCVKEGLEYSDRVHLGGKESSKNHNDSNEKAKRAKKHKPDPFKASVEAANRRKQETLDKLVALKDKDREIAAAKVRRNTKRNEMMRRNRKGQPIMKNQIFHLLEKAKSSA